MMQTLAKVVYVVVFLAFNCCGYAVAQDIEKLSTLDNERFEYHLDKSPQLITTTRWELFFNGAEKRIENQDYANAQNYSEKARMLADRLSKDQLIYKSYGQLGRITFFRKDYYSARRFFDKSIRQLKILKEDDEHSELVFTPEFAYTYYYWAYTYSDPDIIYKDFNRAFRILNYVLKIAKNKTGKEFDEIYVLTSLQIARCFGYTGNHLAKLLWLEKAKLRFPSDVESQNKLQFEIAEESLDTHNRIGDYSLSEKDLNKLDDLSKKLPLDFRIRYLLLMANFKGQINSIKEKHEFLDRGIALIKRSSLSTHLTNFYVSKLFQLILDKNIAEAKIYLDLLETAAGKDSQNVNKMDTYVANAVIKYHEGDSVAGDAYFSKAEEYWMKAGSEWQNGHFLYGWWSETMLLEKNFRKLDTIGQKYLALVNKFNEKDSLPFIYVILARSYLASGNLAESRRLTKKAIAVIEEKRFSRSADISTGVFEHLYEAYELETQLNLRENKNADAFMSSDRYKARWLNDKITQQPSTQRVTIDEESKKLIIDLSAKVLNEPTDQALFRQLSEVEKKALKIGSNYELKNNDLATDDELVIGLTSSTIDDDTAVVAYAFTLENKLAAFVWTRQHGLSHRVLHMTKEEAEKIAANVQYKIKNLIFFKQDGKQLYDKLIKPLDIGTTNLIIVPDKSLWKIPFQALSPDGKKYLIEDKLISYAPSISILLDQLKKPKPNRRTLQVFANSTFDNKSLQYVNSEAKSVADIYDAKPILNATITDFEKLSGKSDINHFSMHAQVANEQPLDSFLAFRNNDKNDGRLTIEEILDINLKPGSLAFLASCDTTNVLNGEGLVSLSWAMMASGATTVISAQWEANDKSTEVFTRSFYKNYHKGSSSAEALQKASLELIQNKASNMHEPYYWAEFILYGDFR